MNRQNCSLISEVKTGKETLYFEIHDTNNFDKENPEYVSQLNLSELNSQKPLRKFLEFIAKGGRRTELKVEIEAQWIFCKEKYLKDKLEEFKLEIHDVNKEIKEEENLLKMFYEPFPELKNNRNKTKNKNENNFFNTNTGGVKPDLKNEFKSSEVKEQKFKQHYNEQNLSKIEKILFYLMLVYFTIAIIDCIYFCRFLEVLL